MRSPHKIVAALYAVVLVAFTTYVLLDTFMISRVETQIVTRPRFDPPTQSTLLDPTQAPDPTVMNTEATAPAPPQETTEPSATTGTVPTPPPVTSPEDPTTTAPSPTVVPTQAPTEAPTEVPTEAPTEAPTGPQPVITDRSYHDSHISIELKEYREYDTAIYVADVRVSSAEYLKTAFAKDSFGRNIKETTSDMAEHNDAILAINGDYYGSRREGYVLRNGVLYRSEGAPERQDLMIDYEGNFRIYSEGTTSAETLSSYGAWQIFSFGPALVREGQVVVDENTEVGQATWSNPRTAIAQVDELHYLLVVSDGRTDASRGLSLYQLATFLQSMGARTVYNLDGGGSSTMWFNGRVINQPVDHGSEVSERKVSDIVYIGY